MVVEVDHNHEGFEGVGDRGTHELCAVRGQRTGRRGWISHCGGVAVLGSNRSVHKVTPHQDSPD